MIVKIIVGGWVVSFFFATQCIVTHDQHKQLNYHGRTHYKHKIHHGT